MKLWVDDIRNAPDDSWVVARTVSAAIRAIARFDFQEISLDHDISHQVAVGAKSRPFPCEETFQPVAYFIGAKYWRQVVVAGGVGALRPFVAPKITLHTSNPAGAEEMSKILADHGIPVEIKRMGAANRLELEL